MMIQMEKMSDMMKSTKLKAWYVAAYPADDLAEEMNDGSTFYGLFECLDRRSDVYKYIGIGDSVIRERLFRKLAELMEVDYDYIYNQWLL